MVTRNNHAIVCLPGILARCEEQHRPLWLERFAEVVVYFDYDQTHFDGETEVSKALGKIESLRDQGFTVTLLGSSLGANVGAFVSQKLQQKHSDLDWFRFRAVDGPFGSRTFTATSSMKPSLITSWFGSLIFTVAGWFILFVGRMGPGLPKDTLITMPGGNIRQHMSGGTSKFSDEEWQHWVKAAAKRSLGGHKTRVWAQQLQWMTRVAENSSLDRAVRSLQGIDTVYVQCTKGNDVVVQNKALMLWLERMSSRDDDGKPRWRTVRAPHCGYLQMQREFDLQIIQVLADR